MNMNEIRKNFDTQKIINEFPALKQKVWDKSLVYLDSAASMQKPKDVIDVINNNLFSPIFPSSDFNLSNLLPR